MVVDGGWIRVGLLGATGLVGQRIIRFLEPHRTLRVVRVGASGRSVGRPYLKAAQWSLPGDPPADVEDWTVVACEPEAFEDCDVVLSGLDATTGLDVEGRFAAAGHVVVSNSSAYRMAPDVPLVVPEVNGSHVRLVENRPPGRGCIITNPNCSVTGLALALAPLHRAFGVRQVVVSTLQAISGAGVEGPRALHLTDNVIPFIAGEEDKIETELGKILGVVVDGTVEAAPIAVSAHCHRVPTIDGHLEAVSVGLGMRVAAADAIAALRGFRGEVADLALPSAPVPPIVVREEDDRPQPRYDRDAGGGMAVTVGRVRSCPVLDLRLELLSHNTIRGAAGAAVLNAELLAARGVIGPRGRR